MFYTFAGTSVLNGVLKVRFANSDARAKQLAKLGDTDVNIVELPTPMTKDAVVAYLLSVDFAKTDEVRAALAAEVAPRAKTVRTVKIRVKQSVKAKAPAKAKPAPRETEATDAEVEALYTAIYGNQ